MSQRIEPSDMAPMQGPPGGFYVIVPQRKEEARIDLTRVGQVLGRAWIALLVAAVIGGVVFGVIAFQMHNLYRAQALLYPVVPGDSGMERVLGGQLGGLASLVGLDFGGKGGSREQSYATLTSPGLVREFIQRKNLLPVLFYKRWDPARQQWRPGETVPTLEDGVMYFKTQVCGISDDRKAGVVTVRMEWYDRQLAAQWTNDFVALANEQLRADAIEKSRLSIEFLQAEVAKTDVVQLRQSIYRLIESQINSAMLANVQREYAFRTIDRAVASDEKRKVSPHRSLMILFGGLGLAALTSSWVLWRQRREWLV